MTADPPWLDEAARAAFEAFYGESPPDSWGKESTYSWRAVVQAVLAFAAQQPRQITDAAVEAAARAMCDEIGVPQDELVLERHEIMVAWKTQLPKARAALEASEKERCK